MSDSALLDLFGGQAKALITALQEGYYEIPRETPTSEITKQLNVSRRTFGEHLRRTDNKFVKSRSYYIPI